MRPPGSSHRPREAGARARARAWVVAALIGLVALSACRTVREAFQPPPKGTPTGREGWLAYDVGGLRIEAPAAWQPHGTTARHELEAPDGSGRLDVRRVDERWPTADACLAAGDQSLAASAERLSRPRRHATTVAGRRALVLEGDQGDQGHGWAWVVCDGGVQYRIFLSGGAPLSKDVLEAYRTLLATARIGGEA